MKVKRWNLLIGLTVIFGVLWIWLSRETIENPPTHTYAAAHIGFLAPDFALPDQDGKLHQLSSLRGKPVMINFWASWCTPCQAEMLAIERLHQKYMGQGFTILAVNSTHQDNRQAAIDFSNQLGLTFNILLDEDGTVSEMYAVRALPTTYWIDSSGMVADVIIGGPISDALFDIRTQQILEKVP